MAQLSLALAVPSSASLSAALRPQPSVVPVAVITGAIVSTVQVTVRVTATAGLPQASLTFHVRVCERLQPLLVITLSAAVGVPTAQLSVALAVPSAASISAALGLQPRLCVVPVAVITGAVVSTVQVTVRETASAGLPHASLTFHVRVCERLQPLLVTTLSAAVGVPTAQLSVALAVPSAASISAALGLQPRLSVVPVAVITGAIVSTVQVTVRVTATAGLPQTSLTFHVRVCERPQPLLVTTLSAAVGVPTAQLSVALAVPSVASISAAIRLQPRFSVVPVAVITGAIVSTVQVTVRVTATAGLPQASLTFHVRVCERPQPLLVTTLSAAVGVPTAQLSVALAVPSAASISAALGLQPRLSVVPVAVITGAVR